MSSQNSQMAETPRRRYNSTRRSMQAAQTRADVLIGAIRLFTTSGWAGTTITAIGAESGVAVETIYSGFGSKKGVLRAAMDVAVVGDAEPIPFAERDEFRRLSRGTRAERMRAGITVQADIHERSAGVWRSIIEASAGDPEVDGWRIELEQRRRIDIERSVNAMVDRQVDARTIDLLWAIFGPEIYLKLTNDVGLSRDEYEDHMIDAFERLVAPVLKRPRAAS